MREWQTLFFRNRLVLKLLIMLIAVAGIAAFFTIPRLEDPVIINRFAVIITEFPGATAARVESQITERIEEELLEFSEIKEINSNSSPNISIVNIELVDEVSQPDPVWSKIRDRFGQLANRLPVGASTPVLDDERGYPFTKFVGISGNNVDVPIFVLKRYATELKQAILRFPGTDLVRLYGDNEEEILVDVDMHKLSALGMNINMLSQIVQASDSKVPAGIIRSDEISISVEMQGEFLDVERIKNIPIKTQENGQTIRLVDIAEVKRSLRDPPTNLVRVNGKRAVAVAARILPGQKIDDWSQGVDNIIVNFKNQLPTNLKIETFFDQNKYTELRLNNLAFSLFLGVVLVVSVLLITLGYQAAIIVTLTLPMVMLSTLALLNFVGIELHQISIIGLIVSLGLVVDNAIVIVSAMERQLIKGVSVRESIFRVVDHYWVPLLSSTVTTILAFTPMLLLTGPMGEFVAPMALAVVFSLVSSYLYSIAIVPSLAGLTMAGISHSQSWWTTGVSFPRLAHNFRRVLGAALKFRARTVFIAGLIPLLGIVCAFLLVNQFFPRTDRNQFYVEIFLPVQSSIYKSEELVEQADPIIRSIPEVTDLHWFTGQSAPAYYYNRIINRDGTPHFVEALINTKEMEDVRKIIPTIQQKLERAFPYAQVVVRALWQGPPFPAPIEIKLFGPDNDRLYEIGEQLRVVLQDVHGVTQTTSSLLYGAPKMAVIPDEDKLKTLGLSLNDVARDLSQQYDGMMSGSLIQGPEELPLRVRASKEFRDNFQSVEGYYYSGGQQSSQYELGIPFAAIGEVKYVPSVASISRQNAERVNIIRGFVEPDVLPQEPLDKFRAKLNEQGFQPPYGYRLSYGGEEQERGEAVDNLMSSLGLIATLLIATLVLTFSSVRYAIIILLVGVQSASLALLSLYIFGYPFGFVAIMAIMGLVGVAINAGIIIISNLQRNPKAVRGRLSSVRRVIMNESSRHIISTTLTTMLGFTPLLFTPGDLWPPFAVAFIGGVAMTTFVSFFFVPVMYEIFTPQEHKNNKAKKV